VIIPLFFRVSEKRMPEMIDREHNNLLKESFRIFYGKHSAGLLNFIRKACGGDDQEARDIFQETFVRLFRSSPHGLNEFQFKSYIYKTAFRLVIDSKRKKREERMDDQMEFQAAEIEDTDLNIDLDAAFRKLDKRSRSLLWLAHVEGYSHSEISEMTGIGVKSLKVVLFRTRKKFEKILRSSGFEEGGAHGRE
jgi:RNA polymerase sigma-70 factor (ECF subfamily)